MELFLGFVALVVLLPIVPELRVFVKSLMKDINSGFESNNPTTKK